MLYRNWGILARRRLLLLLGLIVLLTSGGGDAREPGAAGGLQTARVVPRRSLSPAHRETPQNVGLPMQGRAVDNRAQLEVRENQPRGTLVGRIPVVQGYSYRFNEPPREFTLDPLTGEIRTALAIDREALPTDRFDLVVLSSQPTYPIEVRILVLDENDNSPEFPEPSIAVSFSESAAAGTRLLLDAASDRDGPENGVADDYFIVEGNQDGKFRLSVTGNPLAGTSYLHLETTGQLDRELVEFYQLKVCARDRGRPPRLGCLPVNVTILDVNDNPPVFQQSDYTVTLNESAPIASLVLKVQALDRDRGDNARVSYFLGDDERQFTIDPDSGEILTAEQLSCPQQSCGHQARLPPTATECPKSCVITVFARDHGSPRQDGRTYVTVNLLDTNDHVPEIKFTYFPPAPGFGTVDENAARGWIVAAIGVEDKDEGPNGETSLEIRAGNELGHFELGHNTQSVHVVSVSGKLDREEIPVYNLTIVAQDHGSPAKSATAYLVIRVNDVNDHEPVFQQSEYSAVLSELSPRGSFVASITATDADSGLNACIHYDFETGNEQGWFAIDQDTGLVTTAASLDREVQGLVELRVSARDGGPSPRYAATHLRVTILDENDEAPRFSQSVVEVTLSENTPINSLVATVSAVDNDQGTNGTVSFSLHPSVSRDYPRTFALDALTGQLTTKVPLDRERIDSYRIIVVARDQGSPSQTSSATVLLTVEDVNDNPPIFYPLRYFFTLPQDAVPGTVVGSVLATDADGKGNAQIRYSLESGGEGLFTIDERSGEIVFKSTPRSSHKVSFSLVVAARDSGDKPAPENALVEIVQEESVQSLEFLAYDGYEYKITENSVDCHEASAPHGRDVGSVKVTNHGSAKVTYAIFYGDPHGRFKIDEATGLISAAGCLDREETEFYSLDVSARAGLSRGTTTVNVTVLDINDNPPRFPGDELHEVSLKENAAVGQEVCFARATDRDSGANSRITYSLSANPGQQFRIAKNSGIVYLDKPVTLPPGTVLTLEVTATDSGIQYLSAQRQIRIVIEDVNDHTPAFGLASYETSVFESIPVNERFFTLNALDSDLGANSRVLYAVSSGNIEGHFGVLPDGQLYVRRPLDRETQDYYALEVTASDQGQPRRSSSVPIVVHIIDENDNPPKFSNSSFVFHLRENEPVDAFAGKLLASDNDIGRNADLTFSLSKGQQDFTVDARNGFVRSQKPFDREKLFAETGSSVLELEATVTDNGPNQLSDRVKVVVHITDVNDNAPVFKRLPYRVPVSETALPGIQLLRVYTTDLDEGLNGDVFYSILERGNEEGRFAIDEATGQIALARSLDRETRDSYQLTVVARDASLDVRLSSTAIVHVEVLDENDNAPQFISPSGGSPNISVKENQTVGEELLRFEAVDVDLGVNGETSFAIAGGNRRDTFHIDPTTGSLTLRRALDFEDLKTYSLNISCTDAGHPRLTSLLTLTVHVLDVNDNPPLFPSTAIVRQILEGIPVHRPVVTVTADDPDSGANGVVTYSIGQQEPENHRRRFDIEPKTGVIRTLLPIDREDIDTFKLTILATDNAQSPQARLSAEKLVVVIVTDVNDNAPVFVSQSATVFAPGSGSTGYQQPDRELPIHQLVARDLDSGSNGLVTYELVRSSPNASHQQPAAHELFRLERTSGELFLRTPRSSQLLERSGKLEVLVRATDEAVQPERRSSEQLVTVIVSGEGGNAEGVPTWEHGLRALEGKVYENEPAGTSVLRLAARPGPSSSGSKELEYFVTNVTARESGQPVERLFEVDRGSGVLRTVVPLDREAGAHEYEVEVYAVVNGAGKPSASSTKVNVTVLDRNDVAPSWPSGARSFQVSEDAPPNTIVALLKAQDPDSIGRLRYSILPSAAGALPAAEADEAPVDDDNDESSSRLPFKLDPASGTLRLAAALDREAQPSYSVRVRADDGAQHSDVSIEVQVTDANDNAPVFESPVYSFDVPENAARGSRVGRIVARDLDGPGPNSQLSYALLSDWAQDVFSLNPSSGVIALTGTLDYEQFQHYVLVAQATDSGLPALSSTVTVYCNVLDLNDNPPLFEPGPKSKELPESAPVGTRVLETRARDPDSGDNGRIAYSIVDGDQLGQFAVSDNGTIYTRKALDREARPLYELVVEARDQPRAPQRELKARMQVTISVADVNDEAPEFLSSDAAWVPEDAGPGALVLAVRATDRDDGRNGQLEYLLEQPESSQLEDCPFVLGPIDGLLRVAGPLDREARPSYELRVTARDRGEPPRQTSQRLLVRLRDVNDNAPLFDAHQYSASVAENASIGASVLQVSASDRDVGPNGRLRYSISSGDENRDWSISEDTGVIRVAKNLDLERRARYRLRVRAEDAGGPQLADEAEVLLGLTDINDNAPVFRDSPYLANVVENLVPPGGGFLLQVQAHDADTPPYNDQVRYFLKEGDSELFRVNASTGALYLVRPLDRERSPEHLLTLVAMDTGSPPLTGRGIVRVTVLDANDHSPEFARQEYRASVQENLPPGTQVAQPEATDQDQGLNAQIRYSLLGDRADKFRVDPATGRVVTLERLDRERTPVYHLTLVAQDSSPTEPRATAVNLTVTVADLNDNSPLFSSPRYTAYVPDSTGPDDFVFGARAVDQDEGENARIVYRLHGQDARLFAVDEHSGVIRARKRLAPSGAQSTYQLQIEASDRGAEPRTATADLVIHLWERQLFPSFRPGIPKSVVLREDAPEGRLVTTLGATTPKTGLASSLVFGIAGGNVADALKIEPRTGEVLVASGFDYETCPFYEAWLEVRDSGSPPLNTILRLIVNVTDANDNPPVFDLPIYNVSVPEEESPPQYVARVSATDADSGIDGQMTYHLLDDFEETFVIDEATGEINTTMRLDRETKSTYELIVEARDRGHPSMTGTSTVLVQVLDINDNPPKFTRLFSVNVTENSEIGSFVIRITSSDQDIDQNANVVYSFRENPGNKFVIDQLSGNVTVAGFLDREVQDEYVLKVSAADGAWAAETLLTITIQDQNDNPPKYEQNVYRFHFPELQGPMAHVGQVLAIDRDKQGPNSLISYGLLKPSDLFSIDPATGDIFSKRTMHYKHSNRTSSPENDYSLTVVATDNGKPPLSAKVEVHINVIHAVNNAPEFEQHSYLSPVLENHSPRQRVVQIHARDDEDFGVNAEIEYSAVSGNGSDHFYAEPKTGWICLSKKLEGFPVGSVLAVVVKAVDHGVPPKSDQALVSFVVTGENRHAPTFAAVSYQVRVPESEPVNTTILSVSASDPDKGPNGMVRYSLVGDQVKRSFSINPVSGAVTLLEPLDYDSVREYSLKVVATDLGYHPKHSIATLTINVSDINDNPPKFNQTLYEAYLPENSPIDHSVFRMVATDSDSPKYGIIKYHILGGSGREYFEMDQHSGLVTARTSFDYEETKEYTLEVVASNPDNSQMVGFTTLLIHITGVNEFYPKFVQPVFHMDVSESAEIGTSVGVVEATDQDDGGDGKVYYLFVGSSNDKGFAIGVDTGIISVSRRLDRETQNRVILTVMSKNAGAIQGNDTEEAQIIVSIQDGNDPPDFSQALYEAQISEDTRVGTKVTTVRAVDKDVRPQNNQFSYSILAGNVGQAFKIDPQSGDIETARNLDRETISGYELTIGAIDIGSPPQTGSASVRIHVKDVNDNGPVIEQASLIGYVSENEPAGTSIMSLTASDPDLPPNGAPFSYKLVGGKHSEFVSLEKHSGLLKTTRSLDREQTLQLELLVEVEDSGLPRLSSEHAVTIMVLDQNDSPSSPRSVHVVVHSFYALGPLGKIADVRPNDPDTSGDYTCRVLQGLTSGAPLALLPKASCDLRASRITPGVGYSLSISGNDGKHPDVVSKVTVEFVAFTNETIDNTVTMGISRIKAADFLSKYLRALLDALQQELEVGDSLDIYSVEEQEDSVVVYLAVSSKQGYLPKHEVTRFLNQKRQLIEDLIDGSALTIGHSPCRQTMTCENDGICSEELRVQHDVARIADSPALIVSSPVVSYETMCKCRDGFIGERCERKQDPCTPNPCLSNGQCRRLGLDFHCSCPPEREGRFCELERGDVCASNPCRNGGLCKESPDGNNFFCLCSAGYRGYHCELETDACRPNPCLHGGLCVGENPGYRCSCPEGRYGKHCERATFGFEDMSYMSFPALEPGANDITLVLATTKPDSLLLYNFGAQSAGRSDFLVLEIVRGTLRFAFAGARSAITSLTLTPTNGSLADGQWRKIIATRNGRIVSLSVSRCKENGDLCEDCRLGNRDCYVDAVGTAGTLNFNNNPLYLGGLESADAVLERPGQTHSDDFVGCVHSVSVNGRPLNLSNPLSSRGIRNTCPRPEGGPCSRSHHLSTPSACGIGDCFDKWNKAVCQCGPVYAPNCLNALDPVSLSEGGYIEYKISEQHKRMQLLDYLYGGSTHWNIGGVPLRSEEFSVSTVRSSSPSKKLHLMFRTIKPDGVLIYTATNKHFTSIELRSGQISYASLLHTPVNMTGNSETSLADGRWHNLTIHTHARILRIYIDGNMAGEELDSAGVHDFLDPYLTLLSIGGVRRDQYLAYDGLPKPFEGCLANFTVNEELQPFNGTGSIFSEAFYRGKVHGGCRGPVGIAAANATDPLSIGITLVIVFFVVLLVAMLASFFVFKLRRQSKEKSATTVIHKNTNAILTGNALMSGQSENLAYHHDNTYIPDGPDLRNVAHLGPEMIAKKFKEREVVAPEHNQRPQRPDIIEREISKSPPMRDEHPGLLPPPVQNPLHSHPEPDIPEHYDLENASSIAPSDIDIVYHYKGYRDGLRKFKASAPQLPSYSNHHKHSSQSHRHPGPFQPRSPPSVGQSPGPTPSQKLLQSTPLARLSPSSELSAQQPRILTLHDISGKPLQSALLATTSSSGGVGKDVLNSNSERSLNSPIMSQLSGSTASRKTHQQPGNDVANNVISGPMGLTAEEIERLNSRARTSSLVSTLDAVSSSSEARGPTNPHGALHLHRSRHSPPPNRRNSSSTDASGNDSFACSEMEYDNNSLVSASGKRTENIYSKPEGDESRAVGSRVNESPQSAHPANCPSNLNYDGFDSSFRGSLSTLVASDDDVSTRMAGLYGPISNESPSANSALSWDYLLNWGPNFENLVGVFIDIAELPDGNTRVPNNLRLSNNPIKPAEEYV